MPPVTHLRQCSTSLGSTPPWGPYPTDSAMERKSPLHKPVHSLTLQSTPSMSPAFKAPTSSIMAPTAPEDPGLTEMTGDTVSEMLEHGLRVNGNGSTVLLLDMRPPGSYAAASIKTAVSLSIPNMLLKRPMYSLDMMTEQLNTPREVEIFSNWRRFSNIVLFDATGSTPARGTPAFCIAQKFRREGCVARLGYLHGKMDILLFDTQRRHCRTSSIVLDRGMSP